MNKLDYSINSRREGYPLIISGEENGLVGDNKVAVIAPNTYI